MGTELDYGQHQRDELRGTVMGRANTINPPATPRLTPERDKVIHAKLAHYRATGTYPTDAQARELMDRG